MARGSSRGDGVFAVEEWLYLAARIASFKGQKPTSARMRDETSKSVFR
jgi:hypothetical protein